MLSHTTKLPSFITTLSLHSHQHPQATCIVIMETLTTLTKYVDPVYAALVPGVVFVAAAVKYGPQMLTSPITETGTLVKGEFLFEDGILVPHKEYLYGYSGAGEHFIVGKKVTGYDYSAWEAEYCNFKRVKEVTISDPGAKVTWTWTVKAQQAFTSSNTIQLLTWLVFGAVCAFVLGYLARTVVHKLSYKNRKADEKSLSLPTPDINAEHSKLNLLWRSTLIRMYREQKAELLSLSELAVYYYDGNSELKRALTKEKKKKGEAKSEARRMKAEHATEIARYQSEIRALQSELESAKLAKEIAKAPLEEQDEKSPASDNESTGLELGNNISDLEYGMAEAAERGDENIQEATEQDETSPALDIQSSAPGLEDNVPEGDHVMAEVAAPRDESVEDTQDERSPAPHNQSAGSELRDNASEGGQGVAEAANLGDESIKRQTEQDEKSPAPIDQNDGPKPRKPRRNVRADGTVRTLNHPDYEPPRVQDGPPLGDRPSHGAGRGNGNRGGNSPARGRGGHRGRGGGDFGWRGGRGGRGGRGW